MSILWLGMPGSTWLSKMPKILGLLWSNISITLYVIHWTKCLSFMGLAIRTADRISKGGSQWSRSAKSWQYYWEGGNSIEKVAMDLLTIKVRVGDFKLNFRIAFQVSVIRDGFKGVLSADGAPIHYLPSFCSWWAPWVPQQVLGEPTVDLGQKKF